MTSCGGVPLGHVETLASLQVVADVLHLHERSGLLVDLLDGARLDLVDQSEHVISDNLCV